MNIAVAYVLNYSEDYLKYCMASIASLERAGIQREQIHLFIPFDHPKRTLLYFTWGGRIHELRPPWNHWVNKILPIRELFSEGIDGVLMMDSDVVLTDSYDIEEMLYWLTSCPTKDGELGKIGAWENEADTLDYLIRDRQSLFHGDTYEDTCRTIFGRLPSATEGRAWIHGAPILYASHILEDSRWRLAEAFSHYSRCDETAIWMSGIEITPFNGSEWKHTVCPHPLTFEAGQGFVHSASPEYRAQYSETIDQLSL